MVSLNFYFSEKKPSYFMEITTDFEAKMEQKINYSLDFGILHRCVGKSF